IAIPHRLLERGGFQGAPHGVLRHHVPEPVDDLRAAIRKLSRPAAGVTADGRRSRGTDSARTTRTTRTGTRRRRRRRLLSPAQRLMLLWGRRMGLWPPPAARGASVRRPGPRAALGCRTPGGSWPVAGRLDLGHRHDLDRGVDDPAAAGL